MEKQTTPVPCAYGNDLIGAQLQASVCAGGIMTQQNVHDGKKLLNALVLAEVLPTLHQKGVVTLIIPANDQTFGPTDGGHHLYLWGIDSHECIDHWGFKRTRGAVRQPSNCLMVNHD